MYTLTEDLCLQSSTHTHTGAANNVQWDSDGCDDGMVVMMVMVVMMGW